MSTGALLGLNLGGALAGCARTEQHARAVTLLDPASQEKFRNPLPRPARIQPDPDAILTLSMAEARQWMGLRAPDGSRLLTTVYGFAHEDQVATPGPTIIARSRETVAVEWQNQLPTDKPHILPIDLTLHIPDLGDSGDSGDPGDSGDSGDSGDQFITQKPLVIHLHGGHTNPESDGSPEAWYTQDYHTIGPEWTTRTYRYDNTQEAAGLWYHDHTVGMTRLNVYAGLAGMYLVKDENEDRLIEQAILPDDDHMIEIVIHDALFDDSGNLYLPGRHGEPIDPIGEKEIADNWPNPTVLDEFFGTHILVNGMAWPKVDLPPNRYRLRLLNGSVSRSYVLEFDNGMEFFQVGSDGGFLNSPVRLTQLVVAPAERMDIVVDFSAHAGEKMVLRNLGPELPFRGYVDPADPDNFMKLVYNAGGDLQITNGLGGLATIADPETTGLIMRFDIGDADTAGDLQAPNFGPAAMLREPRQLLPRDNPHKVRQLVLFNLRDDMDRTLVLLGSMESGSLFYSDEITEIIDQGSTEIWEIYNTTNSAHPIHLHQVQFEVINRQQFDGDVVHRTQQFMHDPQRTFQGAKLELHGLKGDPVFPQPNEQGRKDTTLALAGQVTRLIAHFDLVGTYVWHCHIISHEDYDMMRKFLVQPNPSE
ncbi:multicopper oxidase family protein [Mycobacterium spongiae]|uniref:multicopper oxidase family protein n=1 Tax=Mycobacterium spongiae TaxID=886343 RepID=UPI001BA618A0|nr:multicopper oxidase domain-containing protein [Mycobacterium spongiae]